MRHIKYDTNIRSERNSVVKSFQSLEEAKEWLRVKGMLEVDGVWKNPFNKDVAGFFNPNSSQYNTCTTPFKRKQPWFMGKV